MPRRIFPRICGFKIGAERPQHKVSSIVDINKSYDRLMVFTDVISFRTLRLRVILWCRDALVHVLLCLRGEQDPDIKRRRSRDKGEEIVADITHQVGLAKRW